MVLIFVIGFPHSKTGQKTRRIELGAGLSLDTEDIKSKIDEVFEQISFEKIIVSALEGCVCEGIKPNQFHESAFRRILFRRN